MIFKKKTKTIQNIDKTNKDNIILSKNNKLDYCDSLLIIGGTGTGKTHSYIEPNLTNESLNKTNFVVVDPNGELYEKTHKKMEELGYKVLQFNPNNSSESIKYSPFGYCNNDKDIYELANHLYDNISSDMGYDSFFTNYEKHMLQLIMLYMYKTYNYSQYLQLKQIAGHINDFLDEDKRKNFENLYNSCKKDDKDVLFVTEYDFIKKNSQETITNTALSLFSKLVYFEDFKIQEVTSENNYDLTKLFNEKSIIYIYFDIQDTSYNFLSRMFLTECIKNVYKRQNIDKNLSFYTRFIMDEFINIGNIEKSLPDLKKYLSIARSKNVIFEISVMDLEQLIDIYGPEFIKNFSNILFFGSMNLKTVDFIAQKTNFSQKEISDIQGKQKALIIKEGEELILDDKVL